MATKRKVHLWMIHHTGIDHGFGTTGTFFGRLKKEFYIAAEPFAELIALIGFTNDETPDGISRAKRTDYPEVTVCQILFVQVKGNY